MKSYKRVIGIDICTVRLDIADSNSKIEKAIEYTVDAIKAKITKLIKEPSETLVVCEATGGLEYLLVDALHDAKVDVVVANPARVRDFAKGHGYFEKSDAIDAKSLENAVKNGRFGYREMLGVEGRNRSQDRCNAKRTGCWRGDDIHVSRGAS